MDNSPDDTLRATVEGYDLPSLRYLHVENRGYGAGHNIAIRRALAMGVDYHLCLNADIYWEGDVVGRLLEYMDSHPEVGIIAPKIYYPDGDLQFACRRLPTPYDLIVKRFIPRPWVKNRIRRYVLADKDHTIPFNCPYLSGSFLFFRAEALREADGFDERFFMYPEDIDITRRIHRRWTTLYWPEVSITHEHQAASRKSSKMLEIHIVNMIRYFNKWGWFFDAERRRLNKELDAATLPAPPDAEPGRG